MSMVFSVYKTIARGWTHEHPELQDSLLQIGSISAARAQSLCFLAELDGGLARLAAFVSITELLCSAGRPQFQRCGVVDCRPRLFKSVCDTLLTMGAI